MGNPVKLIGVKVLKLVSDHGRLHRVIYSALLTAQTTHLPVAPKVCPLVATNNHYAKY